MTKGDSQGWDYR